MNRMIAMSMIGPIGGCDYDDDFVWWWYAAGVDDDDDDDDRADDDYYDDGAGYCFVIPPCIGIIIHTII